MDGQMILIVEDDRETQGLISDILKAKGFKLFFASNGREGLRAAQEMKPDLILLDVMMPEMDGFTVQQKLQEDPDTKNIPVVFITAKTTLSDTIRAVSGGAAGYIEKPFGVDRLLRKIEPLLSKNQKSI